MISRYSPAPRPTAVRARRRRSRSRARTASSSAREVVLAEHALARRRCSAPSAAGSTIAVVGAGVQVGPRAPGHVARQRPARSSPQRSDLLRRTPGRSRRRPRRPARGGRTGRGGESGGKSRTPWASIRGSSSSRRSTASCRSAGSSDSDERAGRARRPALGVLGVHRLVKRDARSSAAPRRRSSVAGERSAGAAAEQRVGVEVDRARVDLDVPRVSQPGADQRPHRVQPLQDQRPVIGQVLVDWVEPAALRGGAAAAARSEHAGVRRGRRHAVTARG